MQQVAPRDESGTRNVEVAKENVDTRRYTEDDIATLESGDLTDPMTQAALSVAYDQNDPDETRDRIVFQRSPEAAASGTTEVVRNRLETIEAKLRHTPKNAYLRSQRAAILCSLARRGRPETPATHTPSAR